MKKPNSTPIIDAVRAMHAEDDAREPIPYMYFDFRTGGYSRGYMVFPSETSPTGEAGYSPEYFAQHSEHVTLPSELA